VQPEATTTTQPPAKKEYDSCMIQIRLSDGNTIKATFKPTDPVRSVHEHIGLLLGNKAFKLVTNYPKKVFSPRDSEMDMTTLQQIGFVPTGSFMVVG